MVLEVNAALTALKESRGRLEVLGRSAELAARSLEISVQRFDNGDITSQELALDRDRLTQARMAYLEAFIAWQLAGADLEAADAVRFRQRRGSGDRIGGAGRLSLYLVSHQQDDQGGQLPRGRLPMAEPGLAGWDPENSCRIGGQTTLMEI